MAEALKVLALESRKLDVETVVIQHQISRLEGEIGKLDQTESVTALEMSQLFSERAEFETQMAQADVSMRDIEGRSRTGDEELKQLGARLESLKAEISVVSRSLAELASACAVKWERRAGMEIEMERLAAALTTLWGPSLGVGADLRVALLAENLIRAWARWLGQFRGSGVPYLFEQFVWRPGRVVATATGVTATLARRPLDVALETAGYPADLSSRDCTPNTYKRIQRSS